jgi:hypothetical protein
MNLCALFVQMWSLRIWILVPSHQTSLRVMLQIVVRCHSRSVPGEKWPMTMRYDFVVIVILLLISRKQISLEGKYCNMDLVCVIALKVECNMTVHESII